MKKAYLAISYTNRKKYKKEINALKELLDTIKVELLVFVDAYNFMPNQEKEMMQTAFDELDNSDILIAELSTKSIGVGIEIGYAYAKNKPIIYLYATDTEYSTTASGTANTVIKYKNTHDLIEKMKEVLRNI